VINFKKLVMAFTAKNTVVGQLPTPEEQSQPIELEVNELEFLLKVLGNCDLKGHQVEMFYGLIVKLQNQYLQKLGK